MDTTTTEAPASADNATETTASDAAQTSGDIISDASAAATPAAATSETPPSFWDGAGDDLANHAGFDGLKGKINDRDALAISYLNLQSKIGQREDGSIKPITEDSTPEEIADYREKMGVPATAGDYQWEGMPEGMELDTERLTERNAKMHELGINQEQYSALMDMYNQEVNMIHEMAQSNQANVMQETKTALEAEWGANYGKNVDAVARVAERFGVKEALMESGIINSKPVMDMLYKVHLSTNADGVVKNPDQGYNRSNEKKAIQQQLNDLPYAHKDRDGLMKRLVALRG